jgi:hypothetical protein
MKPKIILWLCFMICALSLRGIAQSEKPPREKKHRFSFYGGVGPSFFFNNLVTSKNEVNPWGYSFIGRFMWEPPFALSLGIETGYLRLYSVNYSQPINAHVTNSLIPFQVVVSMKLLKYYYANFAMGQSVLLNRANAEGYGNFNANNVSLGDFSFTLGGRHKYKSRVSIGGEAKFYLSSGYNNATISILFMAGYNF